MTKAGCEIIQGKTPNHALYHFSLQVGVTYPAAVLVNMIDFQCEEEERRKA
jgi:hypothetical protein